MSDGSQVQYFYFSVLSCSGFFFLFLLLLFCFLFLIIPRGERKGLTSHLKAPWELCRSSSSRAGAASAAGVGEEAPTPDGS